MGKEAGKKFKRRKGRLRGKREMKRLDSIKECWEEKGKSKMGVV
jgi:hypothetical protein